jgi:23S rRNA (adenine2030-N6)-methyltransferase
MNYQHAFHAGNFADVHKHAVLARILVYLRQKPAAFRIIDSHAGAARYDLFADEAARSGEWRGGIARLWQARQQQSRDWVSVEPLLSPYLDAVAACNADGGLRTYPGSPLIAQHFIRPQDRLIACEIEPRSAALLAATLRGDRRVKTLAIDGWTAIAAYVPPKERRGLVVVDPPFEDAADFIRLSTTLADAHRKWPTGIYMLWYPIKAREASQALARRLQRLQIAKILRCELTVLPLRTDGALAGSGLIVVNPPFTLEADLQIMLPALTRLLAPQPGSEPQVTAAAAARVAGGARIDWLSPNP